MQGSTCCGWSGLCDPVARVWMMACRVRPGFPSIDGLADSYRLQVGNYPSRLAITGADCSEFVWVNQGPAGTPPERFAICLRDGPGTWPGACGQT
nr:hypothetical protein 9 [bacterium]